MAYKVIWSPEAVQTFEETINYLANNFTNKEVTSFINTVTEGYCYYNDSQRFHAM